VSDLMIYKVTFLAYLNYCKENCWTYNKTLKNLTTHSPNADIAHALCAAVSLALGSSMKGGGYR